MTDKPTNTALTILNHAGRQPIQPSEATTADEPGSENAPTDLHAPEPAPSAPFGGTQPTDGAQDGVELTTATIVAVHDALARMTNLFVDDGPIRVIEGGIFGNGSAEAAAREIQDALQLAKSVMGRLRRMVGEPG